MKKQIEIIIPFLEKEMKEVNNLSNPILRLIINSTVRAVLEQMELDPDSIDTVITKFLIRPDSE